jgi:hypothetical protein
MESPFYFLPSVACCWSFGGHSSVCMTLLPHQGLNFSYSLIDMGNDGVQVSQVYQTMKISNLTNMISFFDFSVVEKLAVDAVKYNFVQVKVDHLKGVVSFGSQVSILAAALLGYSQKFFCLPDVPTEVLMRFM